MALLLRLNLFPFLWRLWKAGRKTKSAKTKAAEVEHAIRHHLDIELDDDPDLQASFSAALAEIFQQFRDNWQKIYGELEKLRIRIINASKEPTYGLHRKKQMPFFRMFNKEIFGAGDADHGKTKFEAADGKGNIL